MSNPFKKIEDIRCAVMRVSNNTRCTNEPIGFMLDADAPGEKIFLCQEHAELMFPERFGLSANEVSTHPDIRHRKGDVH